MSQHNPLASWTVAELQEQHALAGRYQQLINQELAWRFTGVDRRPPGHAREVIWTAAELCDSCAQLAGIDASDDASLPILNTPANGGTRCSVSAAM